MKVFVMFDICTYFALSGSINAMVGKIWSWEAYSMDMLVFRENLCLFVHRKYLKNEGEIIGLLPRK